MKGEEEGRESWSRKGRRGTGGRGPGRKEEARKFKKHNWPKANTMNIFILF